jgi:hypothetical protein
MLVMVRAAIVLVLLAVLPSVAHAEKRYALLIGHEAYGPAIGPLANPHNDVGLLEQALKSLSFDVATVRDAGLGTLYQAINAYARRLQAAGPNAVGFFYYSGHGAQDAGTNYLIPIDVKSAENAELWDQSLRLNEIMRKLKAEAGNATHFVVFDACRNALKLKQTLVGARAVQGFCASEPGKRHADCLCDGGGRAGIRRGCGGWALRESSCRGDRQAGCRGSHHVSARTSARALHHWPRAVARL